MDRNQGQIPVPTATRQARRVTPLPTRLRHRLEAIRDGRHTPSMPLDWEDADLVAEGLIEVRRSGASSAEITDRGIRALEVGRG